MKHGELVSIAHNLADSLASGIGLMIGVYEMDVFGEGARSAGGTIGVDFLKGVVVEGEASASLRRAVALYGEALPGLCERHRGSIEDVRRLEARFWSDEIGPRFEVMVEDAAGRSSTTPYAGLPGKRLRVLDRSGRVRRKPRETLEN